MVRVIERYQRFVYYLALAGGCVSVVLMLLTTTDVVGRYFVSRPVPGAYEISETILIPVLVYLSMAYGNHINITGVTGRLGPRARAVVQRVNYLISAGFATLLCLAAGSAAIRATEAGMLSLGAVNLPIWPSHWVVTFGLGALALLRILLVFAPAEVAAPEDEDDDALPGGGASA